MNLACAACGFEALPDFAFCPKCGQRLSSTAQVEASADPAPAPQRPAAPAALPEKGADRRPVTVLFADLSGFTALSERLDPEDVRALQTDLFNEMSASIERFDGFVEKYVGDAVMAVFGAPVAHEDDPERAVRAALSMRDRVVAMNTQWARRLPQPLALHIGINTGAVVAGPIGSGRDSAYAVTGDTVNVAARLQSTAGPGEILVSHPTYLLTQHAFGFQSFGAVALKGKTEPVSAYRVENALPAQRKTRGLEELGIATPIIGRKHELTALMAAFDSMRQGRTQLVRIVGEAGAGKSRLLSEFLARLEAQGCLATVAIRRAACSSIGESTYGVPASLLRDAYGLTPEDSADATRRKIATALASMGAGEQERLHVSSILGFVLGRETDDSRVRDLEPQQVKQQIFLAAQAVIERRLEHNALLLIVEDLHWADVASVELLGFLIDQLAERAFMLLLTHRPTRELEELASRRAHHTLVPLEPLSQDDSATLLRALFGDSTRSLPEDLCQRVVEHAGGNPLFLEEMVRELIADGVLLQERDQRVWRPSESSVQVPPNIHGLLLARIDRLPSHARLALQEAAVIGPVFGEHLLRQVMAAPGTLDEALEVLVDSRLLSPVVAPHTEPSDAAAAGRQYRFRHGLFQEVSYQNLLSRRRTELHTRIGEALEALCAAAPPRVEDFQALGHHFRLSSEKAKGARYLVLAGDWARSVYANADAIRNYELALDTLGACSACDVERLRVRERLSDVFAPIGEHAAALAHLNAVREGYAAAGERFAQSRVLRKIAELQWAAGHRLDARRCVEEGFALTGDAADHIERAQLYHQMGHFEYRSGDNVGALEWTQRALAQIERIGAANPATTDEDRRAVASAISTALNTQGIALARLERLENAVAALERSVSIARDAGLLHAECRGLANLGVLYSSRNPKQAIEACERGLETAKRIGDLGLQSRMYTNLAVAYCELTNRCEERGVSAAQMAIDIDRRVGQLDHLTVSLVVLGQIYQCHGDPQQALGYYVEATALAEQTGEPQLLFPCYDGLATLYLDLDDPEQADSYMHKAKEICVGAGLDPDALMVLPFLA